MNPLSVKKGRSVDLGGNSQLGFLCWDRELKRINLAGGKVYFVNGSEVSCSGQLACGEVEDSWLGMLSRGRLLTFTPAKREEEPRILVYPSRPCPLWHNSFPISSVTQRPLLPSVL